ncbi:MAG: 30S ribosomal protein S17 [Actinobacteria bacterium]|nr:30S ribosomal protein S17 [Actinomycetota bacterium]
MAKRASRKVRVGTVVSDAMDKTIVVAVESKVRHPLYGKTIKSTAKVYAHDEGNQCRTGDIVKVMETRPVSRTKCWRMVSVIEKAK